MLNVVVHDVVHLVIVDLAVDQYVVYAVVVECEVPLLVAHDVLNVVVNVVIVDLLVAHVVLYTVVVE